MNSSRIFRQDPLFTPTPLVRRHISCSKEQEPPVVEADVPDEPAIQNTFESERPPEIQDVHEPEQPPENQDDPVSEPMPEPKPAPAIDLEAIRQEAYTSGMADMAAQYQKDLRHAIAAFTEGCRKIDDQRKAMLQRNRAELINLVILLSEKILRHELTTPRDVIAATLEKTLEQAIESAEYTVTLHPDDLAVAEAKAPELIASIRGLSRLVFKTDTSMTRGGCLLESSNCTVDASIELQLNSMKEYLENEPVFAAPADSALAATSEPSAEKTAKKTPPAE